MSDKVPAENIGGKTTVNDDLLKYELNEDGNSYKVSGVADKSLLYAKIPEIYKGLPVTAIKKQAFDGCKCLQDVEIPYGVTEIGRSAFFNCIDLQKIVIPASVETINGNPFESCSGLKTIYVSAYNNNYCVINGCLIENATKKLVSGCQNSIIPTDGSVTEIIDWAFSGCTGLKKIFIPESIGKIGNNPFCRCSGLETIIVDKNNIKYHSYGCCLIDTENKLLVSGCKNSVIPKDGSVKRIGKFAFSFCSELENLEIPNAINYIESLAFWACVNLKRIEYGGSKEQWNKITSRRCYGIMDCVVHCTDGDITI